MRTAPWTPLLVPLLLATLACASKRDTRPSVEALIEQGHQREIPKLDLKVETVETKLPPQKEGYRIGINDVIDVRVPGHPEFGGDLTRADASAFGFRVMEDGKVYLPHVGGVPAAGHTPLELQADLNERMKRFLKDPYVSAYVLRYESQKFFVLGGVNNPGTFPVDGRTTLLQGIGSAGGIMAGSDIERAFVVRNRALLPISLGDLVVRGDTSRNIFLQHGDLIYVPPEIRQEVYVLGEVDKPGRVAISPYRPLTLVAALAEAQGLDRLYASKNDIRVFRGSWQAPTAFTLTEEDLNKYGAHIYLKSGDVIHVAPSGLATWNRTLNLLFNWTSGVTNPIVAAAALSQ